MTDLERFAVVRWETGGAAYDRVSGATHLLDELAMALLEHGQTDPALALDRVRIEYDTQDDATLARQIEEGIDSLKTAGLL
ncbi:MAG: HPr-rel-A system PqqD family peptide chaperone [Rhodocyclaceae bacterium]|nr:HPr-rel-A system PqqD family peptide chaperone [Rhodocyclaceae bacterium]